ncbi:hypothetical protein CL634_04515 [bacterium]|nr:hypothetical protein [bacterium]
MAYTDRNLRPFRQYSEHDVVNLFALEARAAESLPINKGTLINVISGKGWEATDELTLETIHAEASTYNNTLSPRFAVQSKIQVHTGDATDQVYGLLLHDVRDKDENGELLVYNPRKAAEMQASVSGQVVPIVKRGIFLYDGFVGTAHAGSAVYLSDLGKMGSTAPAGGQTAQVGIALGAADSDGNVLIDFNPAAYS